MRSLALPFMNDDFVDIPFYEDVNSNYIVEPDSGTQDSMLDYLEQAFTKTDEEDMIIDKTLTSFFIPLTSYAVVTQNLELLE